MALGSSQGSSSPPSTSVLIPTRVTLSLSPGALPSPQHTSPLGQPVSSSLFQPFQAELRPLQATWLFSPLPRPPPFDQRLQHASHLLSLEGRFLLTRCWTPFLFLRYVGLSIQRVTKCIDSMKLGELADMDDGIKMKMLTTSCMERLKSVGLHLIGMQLCIKIEVQCHNTRLFH